MYKLNDNKRLLITCSAIVGFAGALIGVVLQSQVFEYSNNLLSVFLVLFGLMQIPVLFFSIPLLTTTVSKKFYWGIICLLCIYMAFSLVGNYLFIYPVTRKITILETLYFLLAVIWCIPVCLGICACFIKAARALCKQRSLTKKSKRQLLASCFCIVLLVGTIYTIGYNPAISSMDTFIQFIQAKGVIQVSNWHPPFHTFILKGLINIIDSPSFVVMVQWGFFALVWCSAIAMFSEYLSQKLCIVLTVVMAIIPANAVQLTTVWKDIPYSIALMWATALLAKVLVDKKKFASSVWFYVQVFVVLVFICLIRQNGIVPFCTTAMALIIATWQNKRVWVCVVLASIFIVLFLGPVFTVLGVEPMEPNGKYLGLGHDILGVYMAGGNMPEEAAAIIEAYKNQYDLSIGFNYYYAYIEIAPEQPLSVGSFVLAYIKTALYNPGYILRAIALRMDCFYNIFAGKNGAVNLVNYTDTVDWIYGWADFYAPRTINGVTKVLDKWGDFSTLGAIQWLTWRSGFSTLLVFCLGAIMCINNNKKGLLVLFPWAGQFLSLLLSTGWSDFRYFWPLNLCSVVFFLSAMVLLHNNSQTSCTAVAGKQG